MTDQAAPTHHPNPSKPKLRLPPGSWDTHCHVIGPQKIFPFAPTRTSTPTDAPKDELFALHSLLGVAHSVIVQPSPHGFDNRVTEDALAAKAGSYRGTALLPVSVADAELRRLDSLGFRGVRFHYTKHLSKGATIEEVIAFAPRLVDLGWHLQIHMDSALIEEMAPWLQRSPVPVVIDHMARMDAGLGLEQPAFKHLLRLMQDERFWVKVSGCDRSTRTGPPYADAVPFARKLVAEFLIAWCGGATGPIPIMLPRFPMMAPWSI